MVLMCIKQISPERSYRRRMPFMFLILAIMAGGTLFMIVLAVAGLARNLAVFPLSRRLPPSG